MFIFNLELTNRDLVVVFFIVAILLFAAIFTFFILNFNSIKRAQKNNTNLLIKGIKIDLNTNELIKQSEDFWRLEKSIMDNEDKAKITRNIERYKRNITNQKIEYRDYTNMRYVDGLNCEVLSITQQKGLDKPQISRTYRPEIRYMGNVIQKAQVDVVEPMPIKSFTISFEPNGGEYTKSVTVIEDSSINLPQDLKRDGFEFLGWSDVATPNQIMPPSIVVTKNLTLHAIWREIVVQEVIPVEAQSQEVVLANEVDSQQNCQPTKTGV